MIIELENLKLIQYDIKILESAIARNKKLSQKLNTYVQENWTEFGIDALQCSPDRLSESKEESGWWRYFTVHTNDNKLIGSDGYIISNRTKNIDNKNNN